MVIYNAPCKQNLFKTFCGKFASSSCWQQTFGALSKMHFLLDLAHSDFHNKSFLAFCAQNQTKKFNLLIAIFVIYRRHER